MKIGFHPLRDMLLTIVALSFLINFLNQLKIRQPDMQQHVLLLSHTQACQFQQTMTVPDCT